MLTTPVYGFRYPELDDPAEGPYAFNNLAVDVENELKDQVDALNSSMASFNKGIVGYHRRASTFSGGTGTTEQGIARFRAADLKSDHAYQWRMRGGPVVTLSGGTGSPTATVRFRYTTNGTDPTTSSGSKLRDDVVFTGTGTWTVPDWDDTFWIPGGDWDFRLLVTIQRASGSGTITMTSTSAPWYACLQDLGSITDTGSNL